MTLSHQAADVGIKNGDPTESRFYGADVARMKLLDAEVWAEMLTRASLACKCGKKKPKGSMSCRPCYVAGLRNGATQRLRRRGRDE
jgi:hypothetical protein